MILGFFRRFIFLMFLVVLFLLSTVYSSNHDGCCYNGGSNITPCGEGGEIVGQYDPQGTGDLCYGYNKDENRRYCRYIDSSGSLNCSETVDGSRYLFEIGGSTYPSDVNNFCREITLDGTGCNSPPPTTQGTVVGGSDVGGVTRGNPLGSGGNSDPNQAGNELSPGRIRVLGKKCVPSENIIMSIFATNSSCESNAPWCIYNPYLGGFFRDDYGSPDNMNSLGVTSAENSCVPKPLIKSCYDYKTQENCNNDRGYWEHRAGVELNCEWVESSNFSEGYFSDVSGICVVREPLGSEIIRMNKAHYPDRLNLIRNPSFEVGGNDSLGWNYRDDSREMILGAHHGNYIYKLSNGNSLSHIFHYPRNGGTYNPYLYARTGSDSVSLTLNVRQFDDTGEVESNVSYDQPLSSFAFFQKVDFGNILIGGNISRVEFELESRVDIEIDSVSFEALVSDPSNPNSNPEIFKPVQIFPKKASFCDLCYSANNLNLCTESKSDLLGDCTYMVSNSSEPYNFSLSEYLGRYDNVHMRVHPWQSQSISNSELFCEMYISESSCGDEDNYVNSAYSVLHGLTSRLCKWNNSFGCFKDSNDDNIPDVIGANLTSYRGVSIDESWIVRYKKQSTDGSPSDFAFSCDTIPPNSYIYFVAKNSLGDDVEMTERGYSSDMVGDVKIHLEFSDFIPPSCGNYQNLSSYNSTYLDLSINGSDYSNQSTFPISLQRGSNSALLPVSNIFGQIPGGMYDISLRILDQSGNIDKSWDFQMNMDLYGPTISLIEPNLTSHGTILMTNSSNDLKFNVTDDNDVENCSYVIRKSNGSQLNSNYVPNSSGHTVPDVSNEFYFSDIIINSTPDGSDAYDLTVSCIDVFGQKGEETYKIIADFHTNFVLIEPLDFEAITGEFGYLSEMKFFHGVSSDISPERFNCSLEFDNLSTNATPTLNVSHIEDGFTPSGLSGDFYKNITGKIGFSSDGRKDGHVKCIDRNDNEIIENLVYYYDTVPPKLVNYTLVDKNESSEKFVYYSQRDKRFYTRLNGNQEFNVNLSLNGTVTWIDGSLNITFGNDELELVHSNVEYSESINFSANSTMGWIYFSYIPSVYTPSPLSGKDRGLNLFNYTVEFKDKAGNVGSGRVEIYQDNLTPSLELRGDVKESLVSDSNKVYTAVEQPNINVTLNFPSYRNFSCEVSLRQGEGLETDYGTRNFSSVGSFMEFGIADFHSSINLSKDGVFDLDLKCVDVYDVSSMKSYVLVYDDVPPILNGIELIGGPIKAFEHRIGNFPFKDLNDSVRFNLSNVENEDGYNCTLNIVPDSRGSGYYNCKSTNVVLYSPNLDSDSLVLLRGREQNSADDSMCARQDNFDSLLSGSAGNDVMTNFIITARCEDSAGLESSPQNYTFSVGYYIEGFIGSDISYLNGMPHLSAYSVFPFSNVKVVTEEDIVDVANSGEILVDDLPQQNLSEGGVYTYGRDLDVSGYPDGIYDIRFDGYYNAANPSGETRNVLRVDTITPNVSISIPDEEGGEVFTSEFRINLNGSDSPPSGELKVIKLYLDNALIYEENIDDNVVFMNDTFLIGSNVSHFVSDGSFDNIRYLNKDLTFMAGKFNQTYTFRVELYDYVGNVGSDSVTVTVNPIINYDMVSTPGQSYVLGPLHLITNLSAPVISFRVSANDLTCRVYPFVDSKWGHLVMNEISYYEAVRDSDEADKHSIDLSTVPSFSFDSILEDENGGKSVDVKLSCQNEGIWVNQTIDLRWVDRFSIPDYVLESSNGFRINEYPYLTDITITSVGPFRPIRCMYSFDGSAPSIEFDEALYPQDFALNFKFMYSFNFSSFSDGDYTMKLLCNNAFDIDGPLKEYSFVVAKDEPLVINWAKLIGGSGEQILQEDDINYVADSNAGLEISLNRKDVSCQYKLDDSGGFIDIIISFFRRIFFLGWEDLSSSQRYEVTSQDDIVFDSEHDLSIRCSYDNKDAVKRYDVRYVDNTNPLNISLSSVNGLS